MLEDRRMKVRAVLAGIKALVCSVGLGEGNVKVLSGAADHG